MVEKYRELVSNNIDPVTAGAQAFGDLRKLKEPQFLYPAAEFPSP